MKYLCLVYFEEAKLNALAPEEFDRLVEEAVAYDDHLKSSGSYIVSQVLQGVDAATTLRRRSGQLSVTDGPFAETKEQLAGFILIEARDLNDAIRLASNIPPGRLGCIEVRPVREL